jgi:chaperone BCS1
VLKTLVEAGAEVDKAFEDELLGEAPKKHVGAAPPSLKRMISTSGGAPAAAAASADDDDAADASDPQLLMATLASFMQQQPGSSSGGFGDDDGGATAMGPLLAGATAANKDKLNLSGLLNVLDGVVDTPERILIMTTNHPEQLDPALIRPGRIDKKILLGYMSPTNIMMMIEHYFQEIVESLNKDQRARINLAVLGDANQGLPAVNLTPAQLEQLAAENDDIEGMITAIESKGREHQSEPGPQREGSDLKGHNLSPANSIALQFDH